MATTPADTQSTEAPDEEVQLKVGGFSYIALADDPCEKAYNCNVPAPTVIRPNQSLAYPYGNDVLITGLSWNETKVDIYIDGSYSGRATLRTHPSEVGNFWFRPAHTLAAGSHALHAVARSLNELDRSIQSPTIAFTVLQAKKPVTKPTAAQPEPAPSAAAQPQASEQEEETTTESVASKVLGFFFGQKKGTTSATSTVGITSSSVGTLLSAIVILLILFVVVRQFRKPLPEKSDTGPPPDQHLPFSE